MITASERINHELDIARAREQEAARAANKIADLEAALLTVRTDYAILTAATWVIVAERGTGRQAKRQAQAVRELLTRENDRLQEKGAVL